MGERGIHALLCGGIQPEVFMARRYLVTTYSSNWGDQIRDSGCYPHNVYRDPSAAQEEAMRRQAQGVRGVVIYPFDIPAIVNNC